MSSRGRNPLTKPRWGLPYDMVQGTPTTPPMFHASAPWHRAIPPRCICFHGPWGGGMCEEYVMFFNRAQDCAKAAERVTRKGCRRERRTKPRQCPFNPPPRAGGNERLQPLPHPRPRPRPLSVHRGAWFGWSPCPVTHRTPNILSTHITPCEHYGCPTSAGLNGFPSSWQKILNLSLERLSLWLLVSSRNFFPSYLKMLNHLLLLS